MSPHTDAGELLKLADELDECSFKPNVNSRFVGARDLMKRAAVALRQAASQGSAGGEQSEVQTTPVSYRWRQPGNKHWIYDPTPAWIEDHKHEIELEALYLGAAQASPRSTEITKEMALAGRKALALVADRMEEAKLLATSSIDFWQRVGHEPANEIYAAMVEASVVPSASRGTEA